MTRALDLYSGLEGWANVARSFGIDTVTLDYEPRFEADIVRDILTVESLDELEREGPFDLIFASPPCEAFSTGSIGKHWGGGARAYEPKTDAARLALRIVEHTFALIDAYLADHHAGYVIENPRGVMRKITPRPPTGTTWYCQWGETRAKPTDLWTNMHLYTPHASTRCDGVGDTGDGWPTCYNGCDDHDAQSRYYWKRVALGQTGGTQGLANAAERAVIPYALAEAFIEYALEGIRPLTIGERE